MIRLKRKGQAEIMDGLILMLIAGTCGVVLLSVSSNYGSLPIEIYEETYSQKLAQNTLLSLYHITYLDDATSPFYKKSIMVAVSNDLSDGDTTLTNGRPMIKSILDQYSDQLGWEFMFAILEDQQINDNSFVSSDEPRVTDSTTFYANAGSRYCASAALTYPPDASGMCPVGDPSGAGVMCYTLFEVCTWSP